MFRQYSQPSTVLFGCGAISILGEKIKELGCKKAMLIFDPGIERAGIIDKATQFLKASGIAFVLFNGVVSDPPDEVIDLGGDLAKAEGVDCLVGIGGGSSMDTAKAISILLTNPGKAKDYVLSQPIFVDTKTPVILVPTTAGTGSEITSVAVISRPDMNAKWSVFVNIKYAIVDPELTVSLPQYETVNTGLDALSHAAEAMTTINWNPHSDVVGEVAIRKIAAHLLTAYNEPDNMEARTEMSLAANFAGLAFNDPVTHVGHAAADAFSCHFHTPHGYNCAIALPAAMTVVSPVMPEKMRLIACALGITLAGGESGEALGQLVAQKLREMMRAMNMKSLKELGYSRETVLSLVPDVVANHLSDFCPVKITEEVARNVLADIYDGYQ